MSYSCFSLPNPVNSDGDNSPPPSPTATAAITQTIGRQLHNVASFLAPPPQQPYSPRVPLHSDDDSGEVYGDVSFKGIKSDLAEISGSFKTGLSLLSPKKAVTEISKLASNLLQFDEVDVDLEMVKVVGITDAVLDFVKDISVRPEFWIGFPLSLQNTDFNMSHVQKDHALAIEQVVPSLATLRHTIHNNMSEEHFWMIYFILLLPRLNEDDCRLLSTPEIVQVREVLLQKLRNKNNTTNENPEKPENKSLSEKGSVINSTKQTKNPFQAAESSGNATNRIKNENNEDDVSSASDNGDWVRLSATSKTGRSTYRERKSESSGSSSDWHAVEDVDL